MTYYIVIYCYIKLYLSTILLYITFHSITVEYNLSHIVIFRILCDTIEAHAEQILSKVLLKYNFMEIFQSEYIYSR
jgi:hypothetical protein